MELTASNGKKWELPNKCYSNLKRQNNDFAITKNLNGTLTVMKTYSNPRRSRFAAGRSAG